MGNYETAMKNLRKAGIPGPGLSKHTDEQLIKKRATKKALIDRYNEYIESGEAAADFEKVRIRTPDKAIALAEDRIYGKATQHIEHTGSLITNIEISFVASPAITVAGVQQIEGSSQDD